MQEAYCLAAGILAGFASSAPIGPINLLVAQAAMRNERTRLRGFVAGVIAADLAWAALAATGGAALFEAFPRATRALVLAGAVALVAAGWYHWRNAAGAELPGAETSADASRGSFLGAASAGAALCLGNPGFFFFWLIVTSGMVDGAVTNFASTPLALFLAGIAVGDLLWFRVLVGLTRRTSSSLGMMARVRLRRALGALVLLFGAYSLSKGVFSS